ncbi:MAG: 30S ribosomal protein S9 [Candidatus Marsarchaeota archaeon]|jgi:small subunit ribosomal protein S9|nr:30S ribosomal protein S9 [Candidatus Marsarchaeota archaeon]MCL5112052.1 30S ribosomal protein S9 [Candidatus Marsarchaeota archaeon]
MAEQEQTVQAAGGEPPKQSQQEQQAEPKARRPVTRRKSAKKTVKVVLVKSKRKEAIARASAKVGKGRILINKRSIDSVESDVYRSAIEEPINISSITKELAGRMEMKISAKGGGASGQAQAIRSAVAKAISKFADTDTVRKEYMRYDRSLLVDDYRRVEPKKFNGPKARARNQTSYR